MERKSIFEILESDMEYEEEIQRIEELLKIRTNYNWTFKSIVDTKYLLWEHRDTTISVDDLYKKMRIWDAREMNMQLYLRYCEMVANLTIVFSLYCVEEWGHNNTIRMCFNSIVDNIKTGLAKIGYELKVSDNKTQVFVVEINAVASQAAEIVDEKTGAKIMEYNRYLYKGDLIAKRNILKNLADYYEGIKKKLESNCLGGLADDIGFVLNNFDLRHNNKAGRIKNKYLESISVEELEQWYDKVYTLIISAIISLERIDICKEVSKLKTVVEQCNKGE